MAVSAYVCAESAQKTRTIPAGTIQTAEEVIKEAEAKAAGINDISFSFEQETTAKLTRESSFASGRAVFKKPGMFRVEYKKPESQIIVSDGKILGTYNRKLNQATLDRQDTAGGSDMFSSGAFNPVEVFGQIKNNYYAALAGDGESSHILLLSPKDNSGSAGTIKLWISRDSLLIEKMATETDTSVSAMKISHIKINDGIKDSAFELKIPKNARLIKSF
jgi:outer membrane lipoprotein carrier protein